MKILSLSIAAYNVENYIENTLDSLTSSNCLEDLEIIVVNDGSKDNTKSIVQTYVDKFPMSVIMIDKVNGGYGSTINESLKIATGKYYKILDGDDWFETKNIELLIGFLKNCSTDIVFTNYSEVSDEGEILNVIKHNFDPNKVYCISDLDVINMHSIAIKTDLIRNIKITEHCFYTDVEFVLKAYINCQTVSYLPINIYCYRYGREGQSVSVEGFLKHINEHKYIADLAYKIYKDNKKLINLKKCIYDIITTHISIMLAYKPNKENCIKFMEYRQYALENYDDINNCITSRPVALAFKHPKLFYKLMSNMKRRKYHLK